MNEANTTVLSKSLSVGSLKTVSCLPAFTAADAAELFTSGSETVHAGADKLKVDATQDNSILTPCDINESGNGGSLNAPSIQSGANVEFRREIEAEDVMTPKPIENPVVRRLRDEGLYRTPLGSGAHASTCPWNQHHALASSSAATYTEADEVHPFGRFCCSDPRCERRRVKDLIQMLGITNADARNRPLIRIVNGELHRVAAAAEEALAVSGQYYHRGGSIVHVSTNAFTGDPSVVHANANALARALSSAATWERYDGRLKDWVPCDPPERPIRLLVDGQAFRHLKELAAVTRQPYFRERDGQLVTQPGYDEVSHQFGVFDPGEFPEPGDTREEAEAALAKLRELLCEFHFVSANDEAAALSAILTAVVRQTLSLAPAFHVRAPTMGSGKSYLCEVISAFAGPGGSVKASYPTTADEATKVVLSLLLANPAVIEFDDMGSDWMPHGVVNRMLTSECIADRILGSSKIASVSTKALVLGSGNNVGPTRDLLRRVATINLNQRCATPATRAYKGSPVQTVRQHRGAYVSSVLTIIRAFRKAGSPRANVSSIASYNGAWSDYCRHPLIWLGQPDPATALFEQIRQDPDAESLHFLLKAWNRAFGSAAITVRRAVNRADEGDLDLQDALHDLPVSERGHINPSKFGWFMKRNVGRIVGDFEIQKAEADGRGAWRVVRVSAPASPALPPLPDRAPDEHLEESDPFGTLTL